jgi:putative addiction module component (TIGR02574 family)
MSVRGIRLERVRGRHYLASMASLSASDFRELSVAERIQLVQDLWDSIAAEPDALPVTDEQRREIIRRSKAHHANPDAALPLDDVLRRIEQSLE